MESKSPLLFHSIDMLESQMEHLKHQMREKQNVDIEFQKAFEKQSEISTDMMNRFQTWNRNVSDSMNLLLNTVDEIHYDLSSVKQQFQNHKQYYDDRNETIKNNIDKVQDIFKSEMFEIKKQQYEELLKVQNFQNNILSILNQCIEMFDYNGEEYQGIKEELKQLDTMKEHIKDIMENMMNINHCTTEQIEQLKMECQNIHNYLNEWYDYKTKSKSRLKRILMGNSTVMKIKPPPTLTSSTSNSRRNSETEEWLSLPPPSPPPPSMHEPESKEQKPIDKSEYKLITNIQDFKTEIEELKQKRQEFEFRIMYQFNKLKDKLQLQSPIASKQTSPSHSQSINSIIQVPSKQKFQSFNGSSLFKPLQNEDTEERIENMEKEQRNMMEKIHELEKEIQLIKFNS